MYDRILVPTDGSPSAEAAMDHALALAEAFDAELRLLYVINTRRYDTSIESAVDPLEREGERCLDRLVAAAGETDTPITTDIELGRPARTLLSSVDAHDVDLVVMGTRGEGGLPRRLLGSVTEYVVTHADVPIHVVPSVDHADDTHEGP
ncbi:universal stress protein [Salinigranum marinum]|uniref:universal stress protein n=1 Tax=Salinigranum marinum TaxID=1515595 RepID=UPI002989F5FF|nr:universal stress protein [Salinigranum marinum]